MRTRQRNIAIATSSWPGTTSGSYTQVRCDGTTFIDQPVGVTGHDIPLSIVDETIRDVVGSREKSNPVWHRKMLTWVNPEQPTWLVPFANSPYGYVYGSADLNPRWTKRKWDVLNAGGYFNWQTNSSYPYGDPPRWAISNPEINESSLIEDCFEKSRQLKADVLLNVVEANQIWPSVKSLATCLPAMATNWNRIRKVVKTASGSFLAWKFGVSPIINDIGNVHEHLTSLQSEVKRNSDRETFRYSSAKEFEPKSFDGGDSGAIYFNNRECIVIKTYGRVRSRPVVRYVLVVKPTVKYNSPFFQKANDCLERFATGPASLAWEKTKFSFVVDWFVDLRGCLRALDDILRTNPYRVVGFTRSLSYHVETEVHQETRSSCASQIDLGTHPCGIIEYKHYDRSIVSGSATMPTWKPRFGKNQAGISAALIAQKLLQSEKVRWR